MGKMDYDKWAQGQGFRNNRDRNNFFARRPNSTQDCLMGSLRGIAVTVLVVKLARAVLR